MIVILLILAGITIATLGGENGLFARAKQAKEETQKETATEQVNLVISDVYVKSYTEKQEEPTLQDIADGFCNAEGTEYVDIKTRNVSALQTVNVTGYTAIYVKLEKYPYEFKIDDTLKIASIDGVEVSSTTGSTNNGDTSSGEADTNNSGNSNGISSEQYETMQATIAQLQEEVSSLKTSKNQLESTVTNLTDSLENYATKEDISDSSVLTWTQLGTVTGTTYSNANIKIDDYKYIGLALRYPSGSTSKNGIGNPVFLEISYFKDSCIDDSTALLCASDSGMYCSIYYNNGVYAKVHDSKEVGIIYGIK